MQWWSIVGAVVVVVVGAVLTRKKTKAETVKMVEEAKLATSESDSAAAKAAESIVHATEALLTQTSALQQVRLDEISTRLTAAEEATRMATVAALESRAQEHACLRRLGEAEVKIAALERLVADLQLQISAAHTVKTTTVQTVTHEPPEIGTP